MTEPTELQRVRAMFERAGIPHTIERTDADDAGVRQPPYGQALVIARADPDTPNTYGYLGFFSVLYFDGDGYLSGIGAWE